MEEKQKPIMFTMRMDEQTKQKLVDLASNKVFKYNNSAVIKSLIDAEHVKHLNQNAN
ncbi:MAG: hypothetical protein ACOYLP_09130 [Flavobacterium sp.]|uniref:hypothetical protein n=1 Tax=Flavobacterium sp. TaxID=239 RepID=UPI003BEC4F93